MQNVTDEYKRDIKKPLRNKGYISVSFGLVNQKAQTSAKVVGGEYDYYSSNTSIFDTNQGDKSYARLDNNYISIDGSQFFLPRNSKNLKFKSGLVSLKNVNGNNVYVLMKIGKVRMDIKGLTLDFGKNIPSDFTITTNNNTVIHVRDNDKRKYYTEEVFTNCNEIKIQFNKMVNVDSRATLLSVKFGYGLMYNNDDVLSSELKTSISAIGASVPQIDFTLKLDNHSHYFNVDNPNSAINYLETGQPLDLWYGYELDNGGVEWVQMNHLLCSSWESDDTSATITCEDVLRGMNTLYFKGVIPANSVSYYDLAEMVLEDAGISEYEIDPYLKGIYTKNPIPKVTHKEALQIIANATRSVLTQNRQGKIVIEASFIPAIEVNSPTRSMYGNSHNVASVGNYVDVADLARDYMKVDGSMVFPYREPTSNWGILTGYYSRETSNDSGDFVGTKPKIGLYKNISTNGYGLNFEFGDSLPKAFTVKTYKDSVLLHSYEIKENITKVLNLQINLGDFTSIDVEFLGTQKPNNRIIVKAMTIGAVTDFKIERNDMTSSPKITKNEMVKNVIVPYYTYKKSTTNDLLEKVEDKNVKTGDYETIYFENPCTGYTAKFAGSASNVEITNSGSFFVTIRYKKSGKGELEINGYSYKKIERQVNKTINSYGKTITWTNPMIDNDADARILSNWLGEYYKCTVEYDYSYRGNPELDVNDIIYQENEFVDNMSVKVYEHTIKFDATFSGKITARRMGVKDVVGRTKD